MLRHWGRRQAMLTLEHDRLTFRFPQTEADASISIDFQRTLRIPDSDRDCPLPPGLVRFQVRHVDDFGDRLPSETKRRGGEAPPIWQAEALWLNSVDQGDGFDGYAPRRAHRFPVAIKVAAGKINAVTGYGWSPPLRRSPQDYMVSPEQPWLDGFAIGGGVLRQEREVEHDRVVMSEFADQSSMECRETRGIAPGGRMRPTIRPDPFRLDDWDVEAA